MNRRKKVKQILKRKAKKGDGRPPAKKKVRYVSKAEREAIAAEQAQPQNNGTSSTDGE